MNRNLLLLTDYQGRFYCPRRHTGRAADLTRLGRLLARRDFELEVRGFAEVDPREDFQDRFVLYTSTQDTDLHYKGFIEDVMYTLKLKGARLIPDLPMLRAHHNKVFMELLRDVIPCEHFGSPRSRVFGTLEEFKQAADEIEYPVVIKPAAGDTSSGVMLARDKREAVRAAAKISRTHAPSKLFRNLYRRFAYEDWAPESRHRGKFIAQQCIDGLDHDWKILVAGSRYFICKRSVRPGDFRSSGSGQPLQYPETLPEGLLEYARTVHEALDAPLSSIDVMHDSERFYLGEFQCIRFGITLVWHAPHHWVKDNGQWRVVKEGCEWEPVLADAIADHLEQRYG